LTSSRVFIFFGLPLLFFGAPSFPNTSFTGVFLISFIFGNAFATMIYVVVLLSSLLQCTVLRELHRHLVPKASYFLSPSKSIYDVASGQSLLYSMTPNSYGPYLTEKTCQTLQYNFRFNTSLRICNL